MVEMGVDFKLDNSTVTANTSKMTDFVIRKAEDNLNKDSIFIGVMHRLANE
ncbi:hypothetical protein [Liquorilactobacillus oeni]|nr:hypothetical protein [Liquorilactobacillus oeni]